jgi:hypothetical protein
MTRHYYYRSGYEGPDFALRTRANGSIPPGARSYSSLGNTAGTPPGPLPGPLGESRMARDKHDASDLPPALSAKLAAIEDGSPPSVLNDVELVQAIAFAKAAVAKRPDWEDPAVLLRVLKQESKRRHGGLLNLDPKFLAMGAAALVGAYLFFKRGKR